MEDRKGRCTELMSEKELRELEIACAVAVARTEEKMKERQRRIDSKQALLILMILLVSCLYVQ